MSTKWVTVALGVLAVVLIGSAVFMFSHPSVPTAQQTHIPPTNIASSSSPATSAPTATSSASSTPAKTYTLADVAAHNGASSCWTAINGKVYDVTSWINQHPGGPEHILALCGTDGSSAFDTQHGGQAQPAAELATFYIGDLSQ